jgi:hypothetical protein
MQVVRVSERARVSLYGRSTMGDDMIEGLSAAVLFEGRDVNNSGRSESDYELVAAAARAVLVSLREPIEQRSLPRAALGALRMLEAALDGATAQRPRR